jgi:hypothetical protein
MTSQRWPANDPLRNKIATAHDAVYGLRVSLHYLHSRCRDSTGQDRFGLPIQPPDDPK